MSNIINRKNDFKCTYSITDLMDMSLSKLWEFGDGQGGLECCSPSGHKESDTTERLSCTDNIQIDK